MGIYDKPVAWAPSKALEKLKRGYNSSPCILTDGPAEFNDTPLYRDPDGTVAAQAQVLDQIGAMLGVEPGDVDGIGAAIDGLKKDMERLNWLDGFLKSSNFSIRATIDSDMKALAAGEAE